MLVDVVSLKLGWGFLASGDMVCYWAFIVFESVMELEDCVRHTRLKRGKKETEAC